MLKIKIILTNGSLTETNSEGLGAILGKQAIVAFQRSSGWAIVGRHELRGKRNGENVSWKDRKGNQRSPKELILLPRRNGPKTSAICDVTWETNRVVLNPR